MMMMTMTIILLEMIFVWAHSRQTCHSSNSGLRLIHKCPLVCTCTQVYTSVRRRTPWVKITTIAILKNQTLLNCVLYGDYKLHAVNSIVHILDWWPNCSNGAVSQSNRKNHFKQLCHKQILTGKFVSFFPIVWSSWICCRKQWPRFCKLDRSGLNVMSSYLRPDNWTTSNGREQR